MQIITVTVQFSPADLNQSVKILATLETEARKMPGCLAYDICLDRQIDGKVFIFQLWQDADTFETYRTSTSFAQMGADVKPLMVGAPQTDIYQANLAA